MSVLEDERTTGPMLWNGAFATEFINECQCWEETQRIPKLELTVEQYRDIREGRADVVGDQRRGLSVRYLT